MPDSQRVQDNERIERADYEFSIDETPQAILRAVPGNFITNPAGARLWIHSGFQITNPSLKQARVTRGTAFLNMREKGQIFSGVISFEGDAQKTLDLSAVANGTYGIYVRFELVDGAFQNRVFWNPTSGAEFTQSIATRRIASWGLRAEITSPGADWFKIGQVLVSASPTLTVTNQRSFFFEGSEAATYAALISDGFDSAGLASATAYRTWGAATTQGALDRNADRATYGVKDLQTFTAAMRTQLEGIMGAQRWWEIPTESLDKKVSRFGDLTLLGNYKITGDLNIDSGNLTMNAGTYLIVSSGAEITMSPGSLFGMAAGAFVASDFIPASAGSFNLGSLTEAWQDLFVGTVKTTDLNLAGTMTVLNGAEVNFASGSLLGFATGAYLSSNVEPATSLSFNLGSAALRWTTVHAQTASVDKMVSAVNTDVAANTLNAAGMPKAWLNVEISGGSGIVTVNDSWNLNGAPTVDPGGFLIVVMDNPMLAANGYFITGSTRQAAGSVPTPAFITMTPHTSNPTTTFRVYCFDAAGVGIALNTTNLKFALTVWGKQ
jgi:hypothetical protein